MSNAEKWGFEFFFCGTMTRIANPEISVFRDF
ncbi:hypothetical protein P872_21835 [Rhodonellum psychrophilum GCM71 = DSM 17998]|uniref:Uncharacterized protein n=1 Tax=Rhodonellum psychrophilum GCM71 = DSM 17998 TaxID=1123057 RepID=U5BRA9_9BACT|nr:hypothetical protein P872_21835 [Rhodonellum psychrophilum GCM71 = DSM 17998]